MKRALGLKYEEGRWLMHLSRSLITGCSGLKPVITSIFYHHRLVLSQTTIRINAAEQPIKQSVSTKNQSKSANDFQYPTISLVISYFFNGNGLIFKIFSLYYEFTAVGCDERKRRYHTKPNRLCAKFTRLFTTRVKL